MQRTVTFFCIIAVIRYHLLSFVWFSLVFAFLQAHLHFMHSFVGGRAVLLPQHYIFYTYLMSTVARCLLHLPVGFQCPQNSSRRPHLPCLLLVIPRCCCCRFHKTRCSCARTSTSARAAASTCRPPTSSCRRTRVRSATAAGVDRRTTWRASGRTSATTATCCARCASQRRRTPTTPRSHSSCRWAARRATV